MAEEVVKTIENVDKLFSEIVVNGEVHKSNRYISPSVQSASPSSLRSTQGEDVHAVELNDVLHNFSDPDVVSDVQTLQQGLANESNARYNADQNLQSQIDTVGGNVSTLQGKVSTIEGEIPSQASSSNQLADKNFVNSSIATNTANFLGTYTSLADIEAIQNPTNNDYAFLQTTDSAGNSVFDRYKYNAEQDEWLFEYELNNSSFTAEQWATINSGLTSSSVSDAINALDVASAGGAGKYIQAISETNGKISATVETMDTAPTANSTKAVTSGGVKTAIDNEATARGTAITNAINALDVSSVGGAGKYIQAISETDGKISATVETMDTAPTASSTKACTSGGVYNAIQAVQPPSVDTAMSSTSTNAVQNKVIKTYVDTAESNAKNLANATGTLAVAHGGTGQTSLNNVTVGTSKNTSALDKAVDCDTAGNVSAKTVTLEGFTLVKGARFIINIKNSSTALNPTLNVNNTGAKALKTRGFQNAVISSGYYNCYYNGTDWFLDAEFAFTRARYADTGSRSSATSIISCLTSASVVGKWIDIAGYGTTVEGGAVILVKISSTNTASNPTFRIHDSFTDTYTTARPIKVFGESPNSTNNLLKAGTYYCMFDGTNWNFFPYGTTNEVSADNMQSVTSSAVYSALQYDYTSNLMVAGNSFTAPNDGLLVVCGIWVRNSGDFDYAKTQSINVYVNGNLVIQSDSSGSAPRLTLVTGSLPLKKGDIVTTKYADDTYYDQGAWRFYKRER